MKKKLEVKIERDGCEVTAKCLHLDETYRGYCELINDGVYSIISEAGTEIRGCINILFVWGDDIDKDNSFDLCLFESEQEAIEYVNNITKLIYEFNSEQLEQDDKLFEIELGVEREYSLNKEIKLKLLRKEYGWVLQFYRNNKYIGTLGVENETDPGFSIEDINKMLIQYNVKLIEPRETIMIKDVYGVEFEVYKDELEVLM